MSNHQPSKILTLLFVPVLLAGSGCSSVNVNYSRLTYDFLRQEDCRRNDPDSFCSRTFVFDYDDYERHRQEYLRSQHEQFKTAEVRRANSKSLHTLHPDF